MHILQKVESLLLIQIDFQLKLQIMVNYIYRELSLKAILGDGTTYINDNLTLGSSGSAQTPLFANLDLNNGTLKPAEKTRDHLSWNC